MEQSVDRFGPPPPKTKEKIYNFRAKPDNKHSLESFIEMLETDIFRSDNYQRIRNNLSTEEQKSLKELRSLNDHTLRVQDKGSRCVLLTNKEYCGKFQYQINKSLFILLNSYPTKIFEDRINTWIEKAIDRNWKRLIKPKDAKPGKIYGMTKTHKESNPARIITSGSITAMENLSIFVKNVSSQKFWKLTGHATYLRYRQQNGDRINEEYIIK